MKSWTIARKTYVAVIASYLIIVAAGWQLYSKVELFIQSEEWVSHTNEVTANVDELLTSLINMETGFRGYSVGGAAQFLEPYEAGKENFKRVLAATTDLVSDNPTQVARLKQLSELQQQWISSDIDVTIAMRKRVDDGTESAENFKALFNAGKGKALMDKMRGQLKEIKDAELALLAVRDREFDTATQQARRWIVFGLSAAVVVGAGLVVAVITGVNRHLRKTIGALDVSSDSLSTSASQFAGSSQTLAEGASEQAASLEETSASLEELSSMTKRNAESSQQAKSVANEARSSADTGAQQMETMQKSMQAISGASADIAKILKTIDEIAFQTNILALNAAVEAARAGTAGAGFAVVADEVRALAQRCAAAAKETAEKIEDCVARSQQGALVSSEVAASFTKIQQQVRNLDTLVAEIATASSEQNQGIGQVTLAMSRMEKITQNNAAAAEESSSASQELRAQANTLNSAVSGLKGLVGGSATTAKATEGAEKTSANFRVAETVQHPAKTPKPCQTRQPANGSAKRIVSRQRIDLNETVEVSADASDRFFSA